MKFSLTKNTKDYLWTKLYQIKAEMSFGNVTKWDFWWWIEKEENLSQEDNAWVYWNARLYWNARVYWNAMVYWNAWVCWDARVYWDAWVSWKLNLTLWYFFWNRYKKEDIQYIKNDDNNEIVCKWDIKVEERVEDKIEDTKEDDIIEFNWVKYKKI